MVCENCGYNNRDGVEFCRHCGIPMKQKPRRTVKARPAIKAYKYEDDEGYSFNPRNKKPLKVTAEREDDREQGSVGSLKTATVAIGIIVIACVIAFCLFAFDIVTLHGSAGSITVDSSAASAETVTPEPTIAPTPVPTIDPDGYEN